MCVQSVQNTSLEDFLFAFLEPEAEPDPEIVAKRC
jgi:hypothetical protein